MPYLGHFPGDRAVTLEAPPLATGEA
jgi:hypothetical protein